MKSNITIALTSCGRLDLLKKTINSLSENIDINSYEKIISEDSNNPEIIKKVKHEVKHGFLKGWEVLYTGGKGKTNAEKHYNALKLLYHSISTKYVFHCEDDWFFKKTSVNFIDISKEILEKYPEISIVQLRSFQKDGGFNKIGFSKEERKKQLFQKDIFSFKNNDFYIFRNDDQGDIYKGFSLNPGLRRTEEAKKIMFQNTNNTVDEILFGNNMASMGLYSICIKEGVCTHIGGSFMSTKLLEKGFFKNIIMSLYGCYKYRIRFLAVQKFFNIIQKTYFFFEKYTIFRILFDILSFIYRFFTVKEISNYFLKNKEGYSQMNIPKEWFYKSKENGITGVARLKNSEDFLEKVIIEHEPFLDEIILVDNQSTDNTKFICEKLEKKFPSKVRFYSYDYEVYPPGSTTKTESNSIHSLAYYYNWCFSKSTKSHVMKLDDDNLPISKKWKELRKKSLKSSSFQCYWGYNLGYTKDYELGINRVLPYSGKYGDHGIYPVTPKTYYIQGDTFELFHNNLLYIRNGFSFFHLKFLKKNFGMKNLEKQSEYYDQYHSNASKSVTPLNIFNFKSQHKKLIDIDMLKKSLGKY